jgi:hypothetical protein
MANKSSYTIMAHRAAGRFSPASRLLKDGEGNVRRFATFTERDAEMDRLNASVQRGIPVWYTRGPE